MNLVRTSVTFIAPDKFKQLICSRQDDGNDERLAGRITHVQTSKVSAGPEDSAFFWTCSESCKPNTNLVQTTGTLLCRKSAACRLFYLFHNASDKSVFIQQLTMLLHTDRLVSSETPASQKGFFDRFSASNSNKLQSNAPNLIPFAYGFVSPIYILSTASPGPAAPASLPTSQSTSPRQISKRRCPEPNGCLCFREWGFLFKVGIPSLTRCIWIVVHAENFIVCSFESGVLART
jgi:hypothetical protein